MRRIPLASERETRALGKAVALQAAMHDVIALNGPLGAGKTTFARGFIQHLAGGDEEVVSPTFTLVQMYDTDRGPVWHFDLYRLERPEDALELGLEESMANGIAVIEWAERLGPLLPRGRLDVALSLAPQGGRLAELGGEAWADRIPRVVDDVAGS